MQRRSGPVSTSAPISRDNSHGGNGGIGLGIGSGVDNGSGSRSSGAGRSVRFAPASEDNEDDAAHFDASERARVADHAPHDDDDDDNNDSDPLAAAHAAIANAAAVRPSSSSAAARNNAAANVHIPPAGIHNLVVRERQ